MPDALTSTSLDSPPMRNRRTRDAHALGAAAIALSLLLGACGGDSSPSSPTAVAPTPTPNPNPNGFIYAPAADGIWGFRVGASGELTPVARGPLNANAPYFSPDGTRVAFWDGATLFVHTVNREGTFSAPIAQTRAIDLLQPRPGSGIYELAWSRDGTMIAMAGGSGWAGTTRSPDYFPGQIAVFRLDGTALAPLASGVLPVGFGPEPPLFASDGSIHLKNYGFFTASTQGDVRSFSTAGNTLRAGPVIPIDTSGFENDLYAFMTSDEKVFVAGNISYAREGAALRPLAPMPVRAPYELWGSFYLRDRLVLGSIYPSFGGAHLYSCFQIRDDGSFSEVSPKIQTEADYPVTVAQGGQVLISWTFSSGVISTNVVTPTGALGSTRLSALSFSVPSSGFNGMVTDISGRFFYVFSLGRVAAAAVAVTGELSPFEPLSADTGFSWARNRGPALAKP